MVASYKNGGFHLEDRIRIFSSTGIRLGLFNADFHLHQAFNDSFDNFIEFDVTSD